MTTLKVGDKIKITSFPRLFDGADGFAGTIGTVENVDYKEKFLHGQRGSICLRLENGGSFIGVGITRMKFQKI